MKQTGDKMPNPNCELAHCEIGIWYTISTVGQCSCVHCNGDMPNNIKGKYKGHIQWDGIQVSKFLLDPPIKCDGCGKITTVGLYHCCGDWFYTVSVTAEKILSNHS